MRARYGIYKGAMRSPIILCRISLQRLRVQSCEYAHMYETFLIYFVPLSYFRLVPDGRFHGSARFREAVLWSHYPSSCCYEFSLVSDEYQTTAADPRVRRAGSIRSQPSQLSIPRGIVSM